MTPDPLQRRPPDAALAWVERELGARVRGVRACPGGTSSAVHLVRLAGGSSAVTVVLRRYVIDELNQEEPDLAAREAHVLRLLGASELPAPELLAADPTGDRAGAPAVVMTRVPGRVVWSPPDVGPWLDRLAALLPAVHATPLTTADAVQPFRPYEPPTWAPPRWMRDPRLWDRAREVFDGPPLDPDRVFVHRDYHPGNVLWRRGRVTGLVDWQAASIGPRAVDVVHCRMNLLARCGPEVADRFLATWQQVTGSDFHPWAEAVMLVDAFGWTTRRTRDPTHLRALESLLARRLAELGR
jgi:aminoglycoside phosphotransferase (APT) family kinase protein